MAKSKTTAETVNFYVVNGYGVNCGEFQTEKEAQDYADLHQFKVVDTLPEQLPASEAHNVSHMDAEQTAKEIEEMEENAAVAVEEK